MTESHVSLQAARVDELPSGLVTLLFTDIDGSTRLLQSLGARYREAAEAHDAMTRAAIAAHQGLVVKSTGDGVFAVFPEPVDAALACLDLQERLRAHPWPPDGEFRVRMGLHTGTVEAANGDYIALAVNQAARVSDAAHGGQVVLSATTAQLLADMDHAVAQLTLLGRFVLKDFPDPQPLFQLASPDDDRVHPVLRARAAATSNVRPSRDLFVGREPETAALRQLVHEAPLVTMSGPGGSGKTRLAQEVAVVVAEDFEDGAWFVDLVPVDPERVTQAVAAVLGVSLLPDRDALESLSQALRDRRLLLVLDNCEHVIESVVALVDHLMDRCRRVAVLATSRELLRTPGEMVFPVEPLPIPESGVALTSKVRQEHGALRLFESRRSVVGSTVCRWRSSWPAPGCTSSARSSCSSGWTSGSRCCRQRRGVHRHASVRWRPCSNGATRFSSRTNGRCCAGSECSRPPSPSTLRRSSVEPPSCPPHTLRRTWPTWLTAVWSSAHQGEIPPSGDDS